MKKKIDLLHVALEQNDKEETDIFYNKILGLELKKEFSINSELSEKIFNIKEKVDTRTYGNDNVLFELFFTKNKKFKEFDHVCIQIPDKQDFFDKCEKYSIKPLLVKKGEKTLIFVKDFTGNIFEIK